MIQAVENGVRERGVRDAADLLTLGQLQYLSPVEAPGGTLKHPFLTTEVAMRFE